MVIISFSKKADLMGTVICWRPSLRTEYLVVCWLAHGGLCTTKLHVTFLKFFWTTQIQISPSYKTTYWKYVHKEYDYWFTISLNNAIYRDVNNYLSNHYKLVHLTDVKITMLLFPSNDVFLSLSSCMSVYVSVYMSVSSSLHQRKTTPKHSKRLQIAQL